jgi:UDP-N-acetylglucosamine 2-epimerase (hydrolysing)
MGLFMPTIDIGSRQNNRMKLDSIFSCSNDKNGIMESFIFSQLNPTMVDPYMTFGDGNSANEFLKVLQSEMIWSIKKLKTILRNSTCLIKE